MVQLATLLGVALTTRLILPRLIKELLALLYQSQVVQTAQQMVTPLRVHSVERMTVLLHRYHRSQLFQVQ